MRSRRGGVRLLAAAIAVLASFTAGYLRQGELLIDAVFISYLYLLSARLIEDAEEYDQRGLLWWRYASKIRKLKELGREGPTFELIVRLIWKALVLGWILTLARLSFQHHSAVAATEVIETALGLCLLPSLLLLLSGIPPDPSNEERHAAWLQSLPAEERLGMPSRLLAWVTGDSESHGDLPEMEPQRTALLTTAAMLGTAVVLPWAAGFAAMGRWPISLLDTVYAWRPW